MTLDSLAYFTLGFFSGAFVVSALLLFAVFSIRRRRNAVTKRLDAEGSRRSHPRLGQRSSARDTEHPPHSVLQK